MGRRALDLWSDKIRPEIRDLVLSLERRGTLLTLKGIQDLRGNSWEWAALRGFLADDALAWFLEHTAENCQINARQPPIVYDDTLANVLAPLAARRILELSEVGRVADLRGEILEKVSETLVAAGFVHEADGRDPAPPRLTEIPRCVRDLADAAERARRVTEDQEAALEGLRDFIEGKWETVDFWGIGKNPPEGWRKRKAPLGYRMAVQAGGKWDASGWQVDLLWSPAGADDRWRVTVTDGADMIAREVSDAPWYDPPFDWVNEVVGRAYRTSRTG